MSLTNLDQFTASLMFIQSMPQYIDTKWDKKNHPTNLSSKKLYSYYYFASGKFYLMLSNIMYYIQYSIHYESFIELKLRN